MEFTHRSVLPKEACEHLNLKPGAVCVDGTLGGCGHALNILKTIGPAGRLIGIDQDPDAIENADKIFKQNTSKTFKQNTDKIFKQNTCKTFKQNTGQVNIFHDNFASLPHILKDLGLQGVDAILVDLGLSFYQLVESRRGFSFQRDEALDMRMDTRTDITAADMLNRYTEKQLTDIFFKYGEERMSRKIARRIVTQREEMPITTTRQLSVLIREVMPAKLVRTQKINPATRVFQALRIAVNRELEQLETFMSHVPDMLNIGGRLCVISFHSLEDRIVKQAIRSREDGRGCTCPREFPRCTCGFTPTLKSIFKKPLLPGQKEIEDNPLSRSAKLRVAERI